MKDLYFRNSGSKMIPIKCWRTYRYWSIKDKSQSLFNRIPILFGEYEIIDTEYKDKGFGCVVGQGHPTLTSQVT